MAIRRPFPRLEEAGCLFSVNGITVNKTREIFAGAEGATVNPVGVNSVRYVTGRDWVVGL